MTDNAAAARKSAERVASAVEQVEDSADRRTVLAADRTIFAAERTYAAWVRTGLASMAAGVGAKAALGEIMIESIVLAAGSARRVQRILFFGSGLAGSVSWGSAAQARCPSNPTAAADRDERLPGPRLS